MKSILLCVTLGIRKFLLTLIFLCVFSVGETQTSCNKRCVFGNLVYEDNGNCRCQCVMRYTGEACDAIPNCGSKSCGPLRGYLRGDCECHCSASYTGERCQTFRCPHRDHPLCGGPNYSDCNTTLTQRQCPYQCNECQESQRPKLENSEYLHISQYGCMFEGIRPSKEMCETLGNNGDDKMSCFDESDVDTNCRRCNNGGRHALVNCPVMCALCDKPEVNTTIASVTSSNTIEENVKLTSLTRIITHVPQTTQTQRTPETLGSGEIAAVVLGVVVVAFIVVVVVLTRRYSSMKRERNVAVQSRGEVCEHCYVNSKGVSRNEHYVTVDSVEDEKNSKYEMLSIDNSADRSNNRGHEYDDATPGP